MSPHEALAKYVKPVLFLYVDIMPKAASFFSQYLQELCTPFISVHGCKYIP